VRYIIGRDAECDLTIDVDTVSSKHLYIERKGGDWYIIDNNLGNGTYINGIREPIQREKTLGPGDTKLLFSGGT